MTSPRRLSAAVALMSLPLILCAQEIASWPVPPYWSPAAAFQKRANVDSNATGIGVEAIEAVPTPPLPFTGINPAASSIPGAMASPALTGRPPWSPARPGTSH